MTHVAPSFGGLVFGLACVCDEVDAEGEIIGQDAMLQAAIEFLRADTQPVLVSHRDSTVCGRLVCAWPMTSYIAKAFGVSGGHTGLWIAFEPNDPAMLDQYASLDLYGISIGGLDACRVARPDGATMITSFRLDHIAVAGRRPPAAKPCRALALVYPDFEMKIYEPPERTAAA